ncbi:hypothetical protein LKL35_33345 [Streptomyces sp. ET3-23]|uniref:hypothetical protein n=1 Tax=Streptomyces sp. ET3-23 TaxID=2885643 RepID=UPI001D1262D5|nr:hypothetical protein [Streptomyces sp. ET3-23]MCC2280268.1 hypothetical protein [Streptomyces sp. ET3-23]
MTSSMRRPRAATAERLEQTLAELSAAGPSTVTPRMPTAAAVVARMEPTRGLAVVIVRRQSGKLSPISHRAVGSVEHLWDAVGRMTLETRARPSVADATLVIDVTGVDEAVEARLREARPRKLTLVRWIRDDTQRGAGLDLAGHIAASAGLVLGGIDRIRLCAEAVRIQSAVHTTRSADPRIVGARGTW